MQQSLVSLSINFNLLLIVEYTQPHDATFFIGCGISILGSICSGLHAAVVSNYLGGQAPEGLALAQAVASLPITMIATMFDRQSKIMTHAIILVTVQEWSVLVLMAVVALAGFGVTLAALQLTDPTVVSSVSASEIVLAFLAQIFVLGREAQVLELCGAFIVFLMVLLIPLENCFKVEKRSAGDSKDRRRNESASDC